MVNTLHWLREEYHYVIRPGFAQMRDDYYFTMGSLIFLLEDVSGWLKSKRRAFYLFGLGIMLSGVAIMLLTLVLTLLAGKERIEDAKVREVYAVVLNPKSRLMQQAAKAWWIQDKNTLSNRQLICNEDPNFGLCNSYRVEYK